MSSVEFQTTPDFAWPDNADGRYAQRYLTPILQHGTEAYVANARAQLAAIRVEEIVLPVTISAYAPGQSYVVSPRAHYLNYAREEADRLPSRGLRSLAGGAQRLLSAVVGSGLDQAVMVNNWLLSTNLYPAKIAPYAVDILEMLTARFPSQPILFRSVDNRQPELLHALLQRGARAILARSVYYQDVQQPGFWQQRQLRTDLRRLERSGFALRTLEPDHDAHLVPRIEELYRQLYLEKYSRLNPQLTTAFFHAALAQCWLSMQVLERDGDVVGVFGYLERNGVMTQPLFGFDTTLPRELSLYSQLSTGVLREAQRRKCLIHASAGAGAFKRLRGGVQHMEYLVVYDQHLPASQRRAWTILEKILGATAQRLILEHGL